MAIKMNKEEQFISSQIILNFFKDNEISFDDLKDGFDTFVETWNEIFEGKETITDIDDLEEDVANYVEDTLQENFIIYYDNQDEYVGDDND